MACKDGKAQNRRVQACADYAYLYLMLALIDVSKIADVITPQSVRGPRAYDRVPIILAFIVMRIEGIRTPGKMLNFLHRNPALRASIGYKDELCLETGRRSIAKMPGRRTFERVYKAMQRPKVESMLDDTFIALTNKLKFLLPDLGEVVSVDATTIKSYTRRRPVSKGHAPGKCPSADAYVGCKNPARCLVFSDSQASLGFKYCSKSPDGTRFVQGYKVLTLACATYDIPLSTIVVTGRAPEVKVLKDLFRKTQRQFPWFKPKYLIADAAYDAKYIYDFLIDEGVEPIINISGSSTGELRDGIYTKDGIPTCMGLIEMQYVRTDQDTGFRLYRCQEGGCDRLGKIKGYSTCRDEVWEDPSKDWRVFGKRIRRGSPEWDELYDYRGGIERIFAWWKEGSEIENHYYRGKDNIHLHMQLMCVAFQVKKLSILLYGEIENPAK